MESHPVIAADMESHHQAAASEIHKELTFNRPKTEISAECEIEMTKKSESSPSTQKSTPTAMKFKTEISADCEIEKVVQMVFLLLEHNCKDKLTFTKLASYKAHHHHTQHPPAIIIICWHFRNFRGCLDFYGYDG
ncbi:hypothetical protein LXL04_006121 [Taraxacum kok-saghyz]